MRLLIADEADHQRLNNFYRESLWSGPLQLRMSRRGSFFDHYRLFSDDVVTYLLEDNEGQVAAMATLMFRQAVVGGQAQTIGYATDLVVAPHRAAILHWADHFLPVLETETEKRSCRYVFSAVSSFQRQAQNALIRPRSHRRSLPRYYMFSRFKLISLHGRLPLAPRPLTSLVLRSGRSEDWEQIQDYLVSRSRLKPIHFFAEPENCQSYFSRLKGHRPDNFLLALDRKGQIKGCVYRWPAGTTQAMTIEHYSPRASSFQQLLRWLSLVNCAQSLPSNGSPLQFTYLCNVNADNPDVFYALLYEAYKQTKSGEFLVYAHYEGDLLTRPPRAMLTASIDYGLYCLLSPKVALPDFLRPTTLRPPPEFDPLYL